MKKIIALILVFVMSALPALAEETVRTFAVNTEMGAMLIDENGTLLTGIGEYDAIELISGSECPPERRLYMVSQMDLSVGFFTDEEDYSEGEAIDLTDDNWSEGWDEELDEVEEWPVDLETLEEGFEMEVVDDIAVPEEYDGGEYGNVLDDDFGMMEEDYMDYGYYYGVALMNANGELLTGFDYISFSHDAENGIVEAYNFDGFVTVLDEDGNILTEGMYTSIVSDCNGGFYAVMPDIDTETGAYADAAPIVHIAADGTVSGTGYYTFSYENLPGFKDGFMAVAVCGEGATADSPYEYIYIDTEGRQQFGRSFEYAANFIGGVAEVTDENYQAHLINTSGEYVTGEGYSYFDYYRTAGDMPIIGNLAEGGFDLISRDDYSVIASFRLQEGNSFLGAYDAGDGFIIASANTYEMVLDSAGNVLWKGENIPDRYIYTGYLYTDGCPGRFIVIFNTAAGYETYLTDFELSARGSAYREIYAISWLNGEGRYQVMDYDVVEYEYDDVVGFSPDFETIVYGVADQDGNIIIPMEYDYFYSLDHDRYWAGKGNQYRLLDYEGKVIAEFTVE